MPLFKYQKVTDNYTTYELLLPVIEENSPGVLDIGELEGFHYVVVPDGVELPTQPQQVSGTLQVVEATPELVTQLLAVSPLAQLIFKRIHQQEPTPRYSLQDELTLSQVFNWTPPEMQSNIEEGRMWEN